MHYIAYYAANPEDLYHHGILGQKWGTRNGPPYPLGGALSIVIAINKLRGKG